MYPEDEDLRLPQALGPLLHVAPLPTPEVRLLHDQARLPGLVLHHRGVVLHLPDAGDAVCPGLLQLVGMYEENQALRSRSRGRTLETIILPVNTVNC